MTIRKTTAMIAAITMLTVGACAKKAPDTLPPAPDGSGTDAGAGTGTGVVPGSQEDFLASVGAMGDRIFFDLDQYNVDAQDQATLQSQAQWLARKELLCRTVTIKVRYSDFTTVTRSHSAAPTRDAEDLAQRAVALLEKTEAGRRPVRLLGVSVHNLCAHDLAAGQLAFEYDRR